MRPGLIGTGCNYATNRVSLMQEYTQTLHSQSSSGGKIYRVEIHSTDSGWMVYYANASIHGQLNNKPKTTTPVDKAEAYTIADKLVKSKLRGTYSLVDNDTVISVSTANTTTSDSKILTMPLHPIDDPSEYLESDLYSMSRKYDGERRVCQSTSSSVSGYGRYGQDKPILVDTVDQLLSQKVNATFDTEALSDRYMVFDLLSVDGVDITAKPYLDRYNTLKELLEHIAIPELELVVPAFSRSDKIYLLDDYKKRCYEGVVFKHGSKPYTAAPSSNAKSGQFKYKFYKTASVICTDKNKSKRSISIHVLNKDSVISVGNVTIPPKVSLPQPGQIIELKYLYASNGNSLVQPSFIRTRDDVKRKDCSLDQLSYRGD